MRKKQTRKLHIDGEEVLYKIGDKFFTFKYKGKRYNFPKENLRKGEEPSLSERAREAVEGCSCSWDGYENCFALGWGDEKEIEEVRKWEAWHNLNPAKIKAFILENV